MQCKASISYHGVSWKDSSCGGRQKACWSSLKLKHCKSNNRDKNHDTFLKLNCCFTCSAVSSTLFSKTVLLHVSNRIPYLVNLSNTTGQALVDCVIRKAHGITFGWKRSCSDGVLTVTLVGLALKCLPAQPITFPVCFKNVMTDLTFFCFTKSNSELSRKTRICLNLRRALVLRLADSS